jgi:hypothetical protein
VFLNTIKLKENETHSSTPKVLEDNIKLLEEEYGFECVALCADNTSKVFGSVVIFSRKKKTVIPIACFNHSLMIIFKATIKKKWIAEFTIMEIITKLFKRRSGLRKTCYTYMQLKEKKYKPTLRASLGKWDIVPTALERFIELYPYIRTTIISDYPELTEEDAKKMIKIIPELELDQVLYVVKKRSVTYYHLCDLPLSWLVEYESVSKEFMTLIKVVIKILQKNNMTLLQASMILKQLENDVIIRSSKFKKVKVVQF